MTDLDKVLERFHGRIQQHHEAGGKFAAEVISEDTKTELLEALTPFGFETFIKVSLPVRCFDEIVESTGDEVEYVYFGLIEVRFMKSTGFGKIPNLQFYPRFRETYRASPLFAPVILDKRMEIIDGEVRVAAAKDLGIERLPAVVINATALHAQFLRLVLNKSNEFQRWHWNHVDAFLDAHPDLLVQLEPLGMFGERAHPTSFFARSVIDYEIHDQSIGKTQQAAYKQEYGLAQWAKIERAKRAIEAEVKHARKTSE